MERVAPLVLVRKRISVLVRLPESAVFLSGSSAPTCTVSALSGILMFDRAPLGVDAAGRVATRAFVVAYHHERPPGFQPAPCPTGSGLPPDSVCLRISLGGDYREGDKVLPLVRTSFLDTAGAGPFEVGFDVNVDYLADPETFCVELVSPGAKVTRVEASVTGPGGEIVSRGVLPPGPPSATAHVSLFVAPEVLPPEGTPMRIGFVASVERGGVVEFVTASVVRPVGERVVSFRLGG